MIGYESEEIIMEQLVNFVPPDYPGNPLDYLRLVLPNNVERAMDSLWRVHELKHGDESELASRIMKCKPIAKIIDDLAAVARGLKSTGGRWVLFAGSDDFKRQKRGTLG